MFDWLDSHKGLAGTLSAISLGVFVLSLFLVPTLVARIPADYFMRRRPASGSFAAHHPALRWTLRILKNVAGVVIILAGLAMLALPGQGILTVLIGIPLLDFPGKRRLELAIVCRKTVRKTIDWMRKKKGAPPMELPREC